MNMFSERYIDLAQRYAHLNVMGFNELGKMLNGYKWSKYCK